MDTQQLLLQVALAQSSLSLSRMLELEMEMEKGIIKQGLQRLNTTTKQEVSVLVGILSQDSTILHSRRW